MVCFKKYLLKNCKQCYIKRLKCKTVLWDKCWATCETCNYKQKMKKNYRKYGLRIW